MERLGIEQFREQMKAQGVPWEHVAFKCVMCQTVQSAATLIAAGCEPKEVEHFLGFSCVGRFSGAGPYKAGRPPGRGCNWTLGGLFTIHKVELVMEDGKHRPCFQLATAEEAQALMAANRAKVKQAEPVPA